MSMESKYTLCFIAFPESKDMQETLTVEVQKESPAFGFKVMGYEVYQTPFEAIGALYVANKSTLKLGTQIAVYSALIPNTEIVGLTSNGEIKMFITNTETKEFQKRNVEPLCRYITEYYKERVSV